MKSEIGQKGENVAVKWLESQSFKIIERNFTCKVGEIDIVAQKKGVLHFVEVKAKKISNFSREKHGNEKWTPEMNITSRKENKLRLLSSYYLREKKSVLMNSPYQIDVIAVEFIEEQGSIIRYYANAITE